MQSPSDLALLRQWQLHHDAHAFKALTQRYGGLVFGICNRVLKNQADAEDITQECFLKLARHPSIPERSVGPWLHSVAVRAAISHIRAEQRRRAREVLHESTRPQTTESAPDDLLAHVDEAIGQLPDAERHCVVAYFLEGKPRHDVAAELGVSTRTVQRKTDGAIGQIREILGRRGITSSAGALAATMAGLNAEALPAGLAVSLGKTTVGSELWVTEVTHRAVAEMGIRNGGASIMGKLVLLAAGIAVVSGGVWWGIAPGGDERGEPAPASPATAGETPEVDSHLAVVSRGGPVFASLAATIPVESNAAEPLLSVAELLPIANPTKYGKLAGRVEDESGTPIANSTVTLLVSGITDSTPPLELNGFPRVREPEDARLAARKRGFADEAAYEAPGHQFSAHTDDSGAFLIPDVRYKGTGVVFASAEGYKIGQTRVEIVEDERVETIFILAPAKPIHGRIVAPGGAAVKGAFVSVAAVTAIARSADGRASAAGGGSTPSLPRPALVRTDDRGKFTVWLADADIAALYVESETHGAQVIPGVPIGSGEVQLLTLEPELATLEGQLLLSDGSPAAGQFVHLFGTAHVPHHVPDLGGARNGGSSNGFPETAMSVSGSIFRVESDSNGRFRIERMPATETYDAFIYSVDGRKLAKADVPLLEAGESTPWEFKLADPIRVTGRVLGTPSGAGLAGTIIRARPAGELSLAAMREMLDTVSGPDGDFSIELIAGEGPYEFTAAPRRGTRATGADPTAITVDVRHDVSRDITIQLPDPWSRRFRLVDAEGHGLPGATAILAERQSHGRSSQTIDGPGTDAEGRLLLDDLWGDAETQITFQKSGYLEASSTWATGKPGEELPEEYIVCYPTSTVLARVLDASGNAVADTEIICTVRYGRDLELLLQDSTDADGWLVLEGILPATVVDLELRLAAPAPQGAAMVAGGVGGVGSTMPPNLRENMARQRLTQAEAANTPQAIITGLMLHADRDNELGDIALVEPPLPQVR